MLHHSPNTQNFQKIAYKDESRGTGPFSKDGWRTCTAPSLRGHLVNAHFQARTLMSIGVPRYDIEVAAVRGMGLGWVVKRAVEKMAQPDGAIRAELGSFAHDGNEVFGPIDETTYRLMLAKSIRFIDTMRLAKVPWAQVNDVYPEASSVPLDLSKDTTDVSFIKMHPDKPLVMDYQAWSKQATLLRPVSAHPDFEVRI
jgi:hypothetical protein